MKESLTKDEHSMVWGRHQTHLKENPLEKGERDKLGKVEKGLSAALWLMKKECKKYVHTSREVAQREKMTKEDTWESEKQMLNKFSETEFYKHIDSGRSVYRPDPSTHEVWQYKDTQSYKKETALSRGKKWESGQEFDPDQKDLEKFKQLYSVEAMALSFDDVGAWKAKALEKARAKGKGKPLEKGKARRDSLQSWMELWRKSQKKKSHSNQRKKLSRKPWKRQGEPEMLLPLHKVTWMMPWERQKVHCPGKARQQQKA